MNLQIPFPFPPVGYRFRPTDEELIVHYLRPKVLSLPFPSSPILHSSHQHLFQNHPSLLPGDVEEKRYFFCKRIDDYGGMILDKNGGSAAGFWKQIVKNNNNITHKHFIVATGSQHPIGLKKSYVFYQFSSKSSSFKTPWILHQFSLLPSPIHCPLLFKIWGKLKMEEWTVCCIHKMKTKAKNGHEQQGAAAGKRRKTSHTTSSINNTSVETNIKNAAGVEEETIINPTSMEGFGTPPEPAASSSSSSSSAGGITFLSNHNDNDDDDNSSLEEDEESELESSSFRDHS